MSAFYFINLTVVLVDSTKQKPVEQLHFFKSNF